MSKKEIDELSGTQTTGHEWDGIKELDTPMPRWWLWTFYGTIVWAIGYCIAYPAIPLVNSATSGLLGYSSRANLEASLDDAQAAQVSFINEINTSEPSKIIADEELARFARAGGRSTFKVYCSQCHGSGAAGSEGYANLNDDEWIWGGTVEEIYTTIAHGVRYAGDDATRFNEMPAYGDGILTNEQIGLMADYVLKLSETGTQPVEMAEAHTIFAENCAACHGASGAGEPQLGGPALNNGIWLYGGDRDTIVAQISAPRHGVMPAWEGRLSDATIKQLAVYVHGLGGGQ
ncbi:cytochrome-c oxidase, cbb3-type subunit III [Cucumibacter marinus]|uniref:cytochrome-c oxidase, cbb3-type subunit III n=1 Tax=Cucumibacter marinus TaxID=1121252 RepID=UPI000406492B|nr:cytochrome-c oxidase, cbb3-type subunit III [Cucumibacter marinus]